MKPCHTIATLFLLLATLSPVAAQEQPFAPGQDVLPVPPPQDAIVLFDGKKTNHFLSMSGEAMNWKVQDGELISTRAGRNVNHLVSTLHFRDIDIHVEFMLSPSGSGNSGVYLHGNYELQIIRSHGKEKIGKGDMGAIYGFAKPLVNAARPPDKWQVYDIRYLAPRRDEDEKITEQGSISAWLNGQLVQNKTRFGEPRSKYHPYRHGTTPYLQKIWARQKKTMQGPVFLQDHGHPTRFRNVWVRPLDDKAFFYDPQKDSAPGG
jgi:hypothetical protein